MITITCDNIMQPAKQTEELDPMQEVNQEMDQPMKQIFMQEAVQGMKQENAQDLEQPCVHAVPESVPDTAEQILMQDVKHAVPEPVPDAVMQNMKQDLKQDTEQSVVDSVLAMRILPPKKERPVLSTVSMRLTVETKQRLQVMAKSRHMSLGEFCGSVMAGIAQLPEKDTEVA